ncbi:MAG: hypothetical protein K6F79_06105 [Saccharofermentans sp.]|nr:hypothetical protein [Saccharofermentans sp.]
MITVLYIDTTIHFAAMVGAVMLWTQYVVSYLDTRDIFERILKVTGLTFFSLELVTIAVNLFFPVLFWFDADKVYHAGIARYVTLVIQILLFLATAVYTLATASKAKGSVRRRHTTVGVFGIAMMLLITIQVFYPLLPLYAMGYMLGTTLLHSFVVESKKNEGTTFRVTLTLEESSRKGRILQCGLDGYAHAADGWARSDKEYKETRT